ncbi:MAG: tRNA (adenosine(37)-N6)-dimethylallyltransferase MiaA [Fibromonadaceae bacterium]|jgi:tRNA dimethylallyltransferase|nr:tRNA (adenosine(37)-N6)-dimethylallyltransferase MiaA [Fibromonadaceae bacterium]
MTKILGAILGATGSGKTELAVLVAQKLNAEIICMDSRQVFKGFRIGTAQPCSEELKAVQHHLVDFLPPEKSYNAAEFANDVKKLLKETDKRFIIVGGTGLYLQALSLGLSPMPPSNPELRESLKERYKNKAAELYSDALKANPNIEGKIMPGDTQRLLRVLELMEIPTPPSAPLLGGEYTRIGGLGAISSVWLDFPRDELYGRINERVAGMLKSGWVEEVQGLSETVPADAPAWQSLGYMELRKVLEEGREPLSIVEKVAQKSRNYAKRQITWFKHKEKPVYIDGKNAKSKDNLKKICEVFGA